MQTAALQQAHFNPSMRALLPLDGGLSISEGIPALDGLEAMRAYANATDLVKLVSPAPEPGPAMFDAPRMFDAAELDAPDLDEALDPSYAPAPRPPRS